MGTAAGKKGEASTFVEIQPSYQDKFGTEMYQSVPENLSLIALLVLEIFSIMP